MRLLLRGATPAVATLASSLQLNHHCTSSKLIRRLTAPLLLSLTSTPHTQQMAFVLSSASRRALGAARVGSVLQRSNSLSLASVTTTATRSIGSDSRVVCITSGKGGVGKTTTAASIGMGLALKGKKTCVIDFDIGLRNLDIHLVRVCVCDDEGGGRKGVDGGLVLGRQNGVQRRKAACIDLKSNSPGSCNSR